MEWNTRAEEGEKPVKENILQRRDKIFIKPHLNCRGQRGERGKC